MSTQTGGGQAELDAARLLLARMGISPADLLHGATARPPAPTFSDYLPVVAKTVSDTSRRAYSSYWKKVVDQWGHRRLDEPTPSDVKQLGEYVLERPAADLFQRSGTTNRAAGTVTERRALLRKGVGDAWNKTCGLPGRDQGVAVPASNVVPKIICWRIRAGQTTSRADRTASASSMPRAPIRGRWHKRPNAPTCARTARLFHRSCALSPRGRRAGCRASGMVHGLVHVGSSRLVHDRSRPREHRHVLPREPEPICRIVGRRTNDHPAVRRDRWTTPAACARCP